MRKLTIMRRKSFVGCAMKDQVYIRDEQAAELTIDGVPCRKLGSIKNGEQKTFEIGDEQQQIFLIVDKLSKNYCNASMAIPEGQEDVSLSGKHYFVLGSNPFQFDGVQLTDAQQAKQKKDRRKGTVFFFSCVILGVVLGVVFPRAFGGTDTPSAKTFTKNDFQITLTDAFAETQLENFFVVYESKNAAVFTIREDKALFGDITLEEYGNFVLQANNRTHLTLNKSENYLWFEFNHTPEDQELYYMGVCYQSGDAFWTVHFATPATNRDTFKETFTRWADSVILNPTL